MANKQYTSIIRLLTHCDIELNGEVNVPRIKKQLLAEFDFADGGFINIDHYSYSKNDVLEEIGKEDFLQRFIYHKKIWEYKAVLAILENNELRLDELRNEIKTFSGDTDFDQFFSPYFALPFNYVSRNFLNKGELIKQGEWLLFEDFLQPEDREEAFRPLRVFLENNIRLLRNINGDNYKNTRPQLEHWLKPGGSSLLNNLPYEFYGEKAEIVLHLINLTVRIQRTNRKDCKAVSRELTCTTDIPQEYEDLIMSNHKVYTNQVQATGNTNNYWWILWAVIILLRAVSGGC